MVWVPYSSVVQHLLSMCSALDPIQRERRKGRERGKERDKGEIKIDRERKRERETKKKRMLLMSGLRTFKKVCFIKLCVCVCLSACLCTVFMQCPQQPKEGAVTSRTGIVSHQEGNKN